MEALHGAEIEPPMPELQSYVEQDAARALQECGMARSSGMGLQPISATELKDWSWGTGTSLTQWEFGLVLKASRAFVSGASADEPPFMPMETLMALATAAIEGQ